MQVVIWILSVLGVIGAGVGLGYLIYWLFWPRYVIRSEESVSRSEFEEFKAAVEAKIGEGLVKPSELEVLRSDIASIEAKIHDDYVTLSQFARFKEAIREVM